MAISGVGSDQTPQSFNNPRINERKKALLTKSPNNLKKHEIQ